MGSVHFLLLLGSYGQEPEAPGGQPTFRSNVDLLSVAVRVTDRKNLEIHGLSAAAFSLYEDGVPQKIAFFAAEEQPVSLGILLDVSSSMGAGGQLELAKEALTRLIQASRPDDELFYLQFHRQVDPIVGFTTDRQRVLSAISKTAAKLDGTSLYDALARALCLMKNARHVRRALLVITDGSDQHSHRSLDELIPVVQSSRAQVFMVGLFGQAEHEFYRGSKKKVALVTNQEIDNPLYVFERLAHESGAEYFFPSSPDKVQAAVDAVARQLRTQYTLAYYPGASAKPYRRIEVKVARSGVRVRARRGFGALEDVRPETAAPGEAGCEQEKLRPYPYEQKVEHKDGCIVYREDFGSTNSGWPNKERYAYVPGAYQIVNVKSERPGSIPLFPESGGSLSPTRQPVEQLHRIGPQTGTPGEGGLVANGPWFEDLDVSLSVEITSAGESQDMPAAAGLVFRLNDRGHYALLISGLGSRDLRFKLVKRYFWESSTHDLLPWTPLPVPEGASEARKKLAIQCRGSAIAIIVQHQPVAKLEDDTFQEGLVGMVLYGKGRAVFHDLLAEESCRTHHGTGR